MNNFLKKLNFDNAILISIMAILLIFFYYKIFIEFFIPITGDELNSILVYSSDIKTLLLKNFPGNVVFFHLIGYLKSELFGYNLITFRSLTFLFLILHFVMFHKIYKNNFFIFLFLFLVINSSMVVYSSLYIGYIFTSFIYVLIFYLLKNNILEQNNKWILFLLFLQTFDHLVNIYLSIPIMISLFAYSNKKKFIKESIFFYIIPSSLFYIISSILTGISLLKVHDTSFVSIIFLSFNNFFEILFSGINRIFFYEAYQNALNFNIIVFLKNFFEYDKIIFLTFIFSILISLLNLRFNKISKIFSYIIIYHVAMFFLINKLPAPRIFGGFFAFYVLIIFQYLESFETIKKIINFKISNLSILLILIFSLYNFDYLKKITSGIYFEGVTFKENKLSIQILSQSCILKNIEFSELQKRNFYFNYLNKCKKNYKLNEFLKFYRS